MFCRSLILVAVVATASCASAFVTPSAGSKTTALKQMIDYNDINTADPVDHTLMTMVRAFACLLAFCYCDLRSMFLPSVSLDVANAFTLYLYCNYYN